MSNQSQAEIQPPRRGVNPKNFLGFIRTRTHDLTIMGSKDDHWCNQAFLYAFTNQINYILMK